MPATKQHGFTLIELSIVLVIIGLIVGGVLAGKALIQQAEIRSAASQLQKMETAYNAFRLKYNCIPGDCANATDYFGMNYVVVGAGCPPSGGAGNGNGNGDGFIDKSSGDLNNGTWLCEPIQAIESLKASGLFPDPPVLCYGGQKFFKGINDSCTYFYTDDVYDVITRISSNSITWAKSSQNGWWVHAPALSPVQARLIDEKIDNGQPDTGKFRGLDASDGITAPIVANSCVTSGAYNLNEDYTCRALYYFK